jgi:phenylpropionate dioxygenase-like ring-hydroxylating dioxygenase large terminal subunit
VDTGTAYGRPKPGFREDLTLVAPGTPMGELLRRYWHPVGLSSDAGPTPRQVRVLGEDLILFRDGAGKAGLLYPRCAHRGTSLYYGKVEERGIRCCYHGWLYDVQGRCLEQPCEEGGGPRRDRIRQPWYPVEERYGLVFAYMGPAEKKPLLPRYECLENLAPGESVEADDSSIGAGGPVIVDCNWLQHWENVADPFHVPVLHGSFSGAQFTSQMQIMPKVEFSTTGRGVKVESWRTLENGKIHHRITEAAVPTLRVVPNPRVAKYGRVESIGWTLPIDDTHFRIYVAGRVSEPGELGRFRSKMNGKPWNELTPEEHRRFPGDYEAQTGQGPITFHSEEHLATSDKGIALLRRFIEKQLGALSEGRNPAGVAFANDDAVVTFEAGNWLEDAGEAA